MSNSISNNVIYDYMQALADGGAIYTEGSQGQTQYTLGTSAVDDGNSSLTYTGAWASDGSWSQNHSGTQHYTGTNGDSISYTFSGTGIDYVTAEDTNRGQVQVYIDGSLYSTADCYSPTLTWQQVCARVRGLSSSSHTIKIVKLSGGYMTVDALNVPAAADVNSSASYSGGLTLTGNVVFNQPKAFYAFYNDIGSQWLTYTKDVEWNAPTGNGGCAYVGHISFTNGYDANGLGAVPCPSYGTSTDVTYSPNTTITNQPGPTDIDSTIFTNAGIESNYLGVYAGLTPHVGYVSSTSATRQVLIAGSGFTTGSTTVSWNGTAATAATVYSPSFLVATAPAGVNLADVTVNTTGTPAIAQVDDGDSAITYTGSWASGADSFQYAGTQHFTGSNGGSFSYTFTGTGLRYITAGDTNRGIVSIAVDGTTVQTANCYSPVLEYKEVCATVAGLTNAQHTVTITKVDGSYMSLDALQVLTQ